ncbi:spore cortex biosynthesis protein YabQ [Caldanaerobius polysaccharolyticus]|uniref:spore cortex biosynthesis protein YabQ n=1 Tax=Caldanaerobius polysaccharolyticus TaxID=44256 RepID=UPI00068D59D6|nr:spore cortex biosynthesis protein YabQ [Caldanaerobius polysaccharolyticus]
MEGSIANQILVFLICMYGGIFLGLFYDIYRVFRRVFKPKKRATYIEDALFWVICSLFVFSVIFLANYAELRFYTFLGFITGFYIYMRLFSYIFLRISVKMLRALKRGAMVFFRIVSYPFMSAYNGAVGGIIWVKNLLNFRKK